MGPAAPSTCAACGEAASATLKLQKCNACKAVDYCGRDCQVAHWRQHKPQCKAVRSERVAKALRETGYESLVTASGYGDVRAVKALVGAGASAGEVGHNGCTAALAAAHAGHVDVLKFLASKGADLNRVKDGGESPAYMACEVGNMSVLKFLASEGVDLEKPSDLGATPAIIAVQQNQFDILRFLADKVDLKRPGDHRGMTPTIMAAQDGRLDMLRFLADHGCDVKKPRGDATPILLAAQQGDVAMCKFLTRRGADIGADVRTIQERTGQTTVMMCNGHEVRAFFEDMAAAGGWRGYVAARRMAYVRIRHEVSKTYKVLPKTKKFSKLRALYHFVFGRNQDTGGGEVASQADVLEAAFDECFEKPEAMQVLPDDVFALICRMLES